MDRAAREQGTGDRIVNHIVDISGIKVSASPEDVLVTYSLGSCVGLTLFDPEAGVGGMLHSMLPLSKIDKNKAREKPGMFVDTGVSKLLQEVFDRGAQRKRIIAKVAGAARVLDQKKMFRIGERNHTVLRKILWKNDILIAAEDIGGTIPRTLFLHMDAGQTVVKSNGKMSAL